ncbi:unnamed protein product [Rhizoctonia solani]|uniref:Uncharacterized protein n=1 Tax=Rhizoctonia solani TaxID=456999 RepID=A0A8H2W8V8_9AGAM|nr:unnamed protein product [Rhizoctonia solani]
MISAKLVGLLTLLSVGSRMAVLGLEEERRWKDLGSAYFEELETGDEQEVKEKINLSSCVAVPVVVTITLTEAPSHVPTISSYINTPTPACSRRMNSSSDMTGVIRDSRLFASGIPRHLNPLLGGTHIPACQDPIILPTVTDKHYIRPTASGRHKIIRPTSDSQVITEGSPTLLSTPVSYPSSQATPPIREPARPHSHIPANILTSPPAIPQGGQEELPLSPPENNFVRED